MHRNTLAAALVLAALAPLARADDAADAKAVAVTVINAIATGDHATLNTNFVGTGVDKQLAETMVDVIDGAKQLHDASVAKFGEAAAKSNQMDPKKMIEQVETSTVTVTGNDAQLVGPGKPATAKDGMQLKKVNGTWKASKLTGEMAGTAIMLKIMAPMATAMKDTAAEITAGKYASPGEVQAAMKEKVTAAMKASGVVPNVKPATRPN